MAKKINSVRGALEYVNADFEKGEDDEVVGVQVRCKGCEEPAHFQVTPDPVRSVGDGPIEALLEFATRHAVCSEIKATLPKVGVEDDDMWEPEGRFNSRGQKRLY